MAASALNVQIAPQVEDLIKIVTPTYELKEQAFTEERLRDALHALFWLRACRAGSTASAYAWVSLMDALNLERWEFKREEAERPPATPPGHAEPDAPFCAICGNARTIPAAGAGMKIAGEECPTRINCPACSPSPEVQRLRAPIEPDSGKTEHFDESPLARARFLRANDGSTATHAECRSLINDLLAIIDRAPPTAFDELPEDAPEFSEVKDRP